MIGHRRYELVELKKELANSALPKSQFQFQFRSLEIFQFQFQFHPFWFNFNSILIPIWIEASPACKPICVPWPFGFRSMEVGPQHSFANQYVFHGHTVNKVVLTWLAVIKAASFLFAWMKGHHSSWIYVLYKIKQSIPYITVYLSAAILIAKRILCYAKNDGRV